MNIETDDLLRKVAEQMPTAVKAIERVLGANAKTKRKRKVTIAFSIDRDKDAPHVVKLTSQLKIVEPKSARVDIHASTEPEELGRWDTGEESGQERIPS